MIAYLQRHRTFLVVVLAITVFAFVGVGFVGWGNYSYGSKAGALAVVGKEKITPEQFTNAYSNLYNFYSQFSDQPLNGEMEYALKQSAFDTLINEALLVNYARDLGLTASDEEVSERIMRIETFHKDGKFSKDVYKEALRNTRRDVKSFEAEMKRQLLVEKLASFLNLAVTDNEKHTLAAALFVSDRLSIKIIKAPAKFAIGEAEARDYYESNKLDFMGEPTYDIAFIKVLAGDQTVSDDEISSYYERNRSEFLNQAGVIEPFESAKELARQRAQLAKAKSEALRAKIAWRDSQLQPQKAQGLTYTNNTLPIEVMETLESAQSMEISNPIEIEGGYVLAQVLQRFSSEPLPFERARAAVEEQMKTQKAREYLQNQSAKELDSFKGNIIGFVSRSDTAKLKGLSETEAAVALEQIFSARLAQGIVMLEDKAVLYRVLEQKLFDETKALEADGVLSENLAKLKLSQIQQGLLETLKSRYQIIRN